MWKMAVFGVASMSAVAFNGYLGIPAALHGTAMGLATGRNLTEMPPDAPELARICREMYGGHRDVRSFRKLGVPYFGVLIIRILLFKVLYSGPLFSETPKP